MPRADAAVVKYHYEKPAIATHTIAPPVQNTWYEILPPTEDVRILYISTFQDTTDDVAKNIGIRVTIDGIVIPGGADVHNDNTRYTWFLRAYQDVFELSSSVFNAARYTCLRGQSVQVEYRMTSVPGVAQTMTGTVQYETLELT